MAGNLPPELSRLELLEVLSLKNSDLRGSLPSEIGFLSALTVLQLSSNKFTGQDHSFA
jgi:Leucine-rich repeat (LRR) protein